MIKVNRFLMGTMLTVFVNILFAKNGSNTILARAVQAAMKGEITSETLIREVEETFRHSPKLEDKISAANLLTYASKEKVIAGHAPYIEFILDNSIKDKVLGKDAVIRLLRLQGDDAFQRGKLALAIRTFSEMKLKASGFLADYATLKLGWAYLNLKQPERAFELWLEATRQGLENTHQGTFFTLIEGLGQAFSENTHRKSEETNAIANLILNEQQRDAIISGMNDGLSLLSTPSEIANLANDSRAFPWKELLAKTVLEKAQPSEKNACAYLSWISLLPSDSTLEYEPVGRILGVCLTHLKNTGQKIKPPAETLATISNIISRLNLLGSQRNLRLDFFKLTGNIVEACKEAIHWLSDSVPIVDRLVLPVNELANTCLKAVQISPAEYSNQLIKQMEKASTFLSTQEDPLLFILVNLLQDTKVRENILNRILVSPDIYLPTLVPVLLAERLKIEKEWENGYQLLLKTNPPSQQTVWDAFSTNKILSVIEKQNWEEATQLLVKHHPFSEKQQLSRIPLGLWSTLLIKLKDDEKWKPFVSEKTTSLLSFDSVLSNPEISPLLTKLAIELELTEPLWNAVSRKIKLLPWSSTLKENVLLLIYSKITEGKFTPPELLTTLNNEALFIALLGLSTREQDIAKILSYESVKTFVLGEDLAFLKRFNKEQLTVLQNDQKQKDAAKAIASVVGFLQKNGRKISQHEWSHLAMANIAKTLLSQFCSEAKNRVGNRKTAGENIEGWEGIVLKVQEQFTECENSLRRKEKVS